MLAGAPPFRGETALSVAVQHLKSPPPRLETVRPDLPGSLCRIVHRMLAKDPGQRYENAREVLIELRALRIDGDGDWPELDEADGSLTDALRSRHAATARLDKVMKTSAMAAVRRRRAWTLMSVLAAVAFALGGLAAWLTRPPFLLADAAPARVPMQNSAAEQFYFARELGDEESLRSVEAYFPRDEEWVSQARRELAVLLLRNGRNDEARVVFDQLAASADQESQVAGLAGQSILLVQQRQFEESLKKVAQLWPMRDKLDRRLGPMIGISLRMTREALRDQKTQDDTQLMEEWLRAFTTDDSAAAEFDDS
jgi:serine/threonine-protein kinase